MTRSFSRRDILTGSACALTASAGCLHREAADVDSRFAGEPCPLFEADDEDVDEVRCYHESGAVPDVYVEPEVEVGNPVEDSMEFTLYNGSGDDVETNYTSWTLRKQTDEGWMTLPPYVSTLELNILPSGDSRTMPLEMTALDEADDEPGVSVFRSHTGPIRYTGSGRYSFSLSATEDTLLGDRDVLHVVLFEVEGPELGITPRHSYEVTGEAVHVDLPDSDGDVEDEEFENLVLRARETELEPETEPLPLELAVQSDLVNDTVAHLTDGYSEVVFDGGENAVRAMELHAEAADLAEQTVSSWRFETRENPDASVDDVLFRFDGSAYEIVPDTGDS